MDVVLLNIFVEIYFCEYFQKSFHLFKIGVFCYIINVLDQFNVSLLD